MDLLIVGCKGREYSIIKKLKESPFCKSIHCIGTFTNYGILKLVNGYHQIDSLTNFDKIKVIINKYHINLVIIGPEQPLESGIVDNLNCYCIGPTKDLAQIETSKCFTRTLLNDNFSNYQPKFKIFESIDGLNDFINELGNNYVIKPDNLTNGKGVKISDLHFKNLNQGIGYANELLKNNGKFLIEEKLDGFEFTLMSFCSNLVLKHMPLVHDYKTLSDENYKMTGGMGCYSCNNHLLPGVTTDILKTAQMLNEETIKLLKDKYPEQNYIGILYGSYIITDNGLKLIEFNCRFGDPEVISIMQILQTDLVEIFDSMCCNNLEHLDINYKNEATVCKYIVPRNYPDISNIKYQIKINDNLDEHNLIYSGIFKNANQLLMNGTRALAVVCNNVDIDLAEQNVENIISGISGYIKHRKDIGYNVYNNIIKFNNNEIITKNNLEMGYNNNIILSLTNSLSDKIVISKCCNNYHYLGQDLVNNCINNLIALGCTKPLFLMNYISLNKLNSKIHQIIIKDITNLCNKYNIKFNNKIDNNQKYQNLIGTITGIQNLKFNNVKLNDTILAIKTDYINGLKTINQLLTETEIKNNGNSLLSPSVCYLNDINKIINLNIVNGIISLSENGLINGLTEILPNNLNAEIYVKNWEYPFIYQYLLKKGLSELDLLTNFNCGLGLILITNRPDKIKEKIDVIEIGKIITGNKSVLFKF